MGADGRYVDSRGNQVPLPADFAPSKSAAEPVLPLGVFMGCSVAAIALLAAVVVGVIRARKKGSRGGSPSPVEMSDLTGSAAVC